MNLKKTILSVNLTMCDIKSLITKVRESINVYKSKIELEEKFVYYFINFYCLLLLFTISFLFKSNSVIFIAVDLSLCQL